MLSCIQCWFLPGSEESWEIFASPAAQEGTPSALPAWDGGFQLPLTSTSIWKMVGGINCFFCAPKDCLCWHSLHEHLERALSSLSGSAFIKSLSEHFSPSNSRRFPPGMCFDFFQQFQSSSGIAWKVIYPGLCFAVYLHVLQCFGKEHKEQLGCAGAGIDGVLLSRSYFQELGARPDPAGQTLNPTSSRGSWAGISLGKERFSGCPPRLPGQEWSPGGVTKAFCSPKEPRQVEMCHPDFQPSDLVLRSCIGVLML